jgi:hypothetical protein
MPQIVPGRLKITDHTLKLARKCTVDEFKVRLEQECLSVVLLTEARGKAGNES